ncbi:hypothetical protein J6590_097294, partial [Homalodisca vitripennis]
GSKVVTRSQSDNSDNTDNVLPTMQSLDIKLDSILQILDNNSVDICDIKKEQQELVSSVEFCHAGISDIKVRLDEHGKHISSCKEDISKVMEENATLKKKLNTVQSEMNVLEHYSHRNNLIIYGVHEQKTEDIHLVIKRLASVLEFPEWSTSLIDAVHRMGRVTDKSPRPIIIKFVSRIDRNEFFNLRKMKRNLKASDL